MANAIAPTGLEVDRFVQARTAELRSLLSAVGDGEPSARRRTRSHSRRKQMFWTRKRRREPGPASGKRSREEGAPLSRRVRRRIAFQQLAQGRCAGGAGKLATHVWHAKRFHMVQLWGYRLALGATGRGHGARALVRRAKEGALLHDASYWSPIQLEATRSAASAVLRLVADPVPDLSDCSSYVNAMVYRCGKRGVSPLAPVMVHLAGSSPTEDDLVKLWIWVHAAALPEVLESLQSACEGTPARCWWREGEFARLEVLGAKSLEVLRKVIRPRRMVDWWERQDEEAAVAVEVDDPRDLSMLTECQRPLPAESPSTHPAPLLFASSGLEPPLSEKSMNRKQQRYRLARCRLRGQQKHDPSEWRSCHMLLLKHGSHALCGWSIVLPLSWVQPFWSQLVRAGASVVGQRERRWLMTYAGRASYPYDFADCPSYALVQPRGSELCLPPGGLVVARSRHLEAQHRDEAGCVFELDNGCKLFWPLVQAPPWCFVRTLLRSAGRGVPQEGCLLYAPSVEEFQSWICGLQKWQGVEGDLTRKPLGFVTSAPPRRCQAPASAVCDLRNLCEVRSWELAEHMRGGCKMKDQVMLLFQNPGSGKLRPALAGIAMGTGAKLAEEGF